MVLTTMDNSELVVDSTMKEMFVGIKKEGEQLLNMLSDIASHNVLVNNHCSKGNSLLELKNQLMTRYMADLAIIIGHKVRGESIKEHPAVWRLVENRVYLEKMQPLELKLKYQIDKLVLAHKHGRAGEPDALKYKPNVDNFACLSDDNKSGNGTDDNGGDNGSGEGEDAVENEGKEIYEVAKVAPVPYDRMTGGEKKEKQMSTDVRRAISTAMIREELQGMLDEPEEITDQGHFHKVSQLEKRKERMNYEEEYFVRTSVSKKEKNEFKRKARSSELDGLVRLDVLDGGMDHDIGSVSKKNRLSKSSRGKGKLKGKRKGGKRFRH